MAQKVALLKPISISVSHRNNNQKLKIQDKIPHVLGDNPCMEVKENFNSKIMLILNLKLQNYQAKKR